MIRRTTCFFLLFFSASVFAQSLPIDQGTIADIVEKEGGAVVNIDIIKNIHDDLPFFHEHHKTDDTGDTKTDIHKGFNVRGNSNGNLRRKSCAIDGR